MKLSERIAWLEAPEPEEGPMTEEQKAIIQLYCVVKKVAAEASPLLSWVDNTDEIDKIAGDL